MIYYESELVAVHQGDCLEVLPTLPDNSVDAVVTDPPYGLEFMGKDWDRFRPEEYRGGRWDGQGLTITSGDTTGQGADEMADRLKALPSLTYKANQKCRTCGKWQRDKPHRKCICAAPDFEPRANDRSNGFQAWCELWATECLRILKPGGHLLAFGGTRTAHRLACAIEDAGFEIRDSIAWLYGCLSDDTEILTNEGWVRYDKATIDQRVLAFDTATGDLEWQQIQHVHRYWHDGEMVRIHSEHTDQLLTPNHRIVLDHAGRLPYIPQGLDPRELCSLRDGVLEAERLAEADQRALLLLPVQRGTPRSGVEAAWPQGPSGLDRREPEVLQGEDEWGTQPGLEGRRYRVQEARQLCRGPVRQSAGVGAADGPQGRLHHGAPPADGGHVWLSADPGRGGQPREPQALGQPVREPDPLAIEPDSQALRVGQVGGRNLLPSTAVEASWVDYAGVVWCITVPHGAFIARRNGLIFATGNSGFPKSLDVSKAIDKAAGVERAVVGSKLGQPGYSLAAGRGRATFNSAADGSLNNSEAECAVSAPGTPEAEQWQGWGTALKPAHEPIIVARKPLAGTVAANVLTYGTGALNIDAARINPGEPVPGGGGGERSARHSAGGSDGWMGEARPGNLSLPHAAGRWPANVVLDEHAAQELDQQSGEVRASGAINVSRTEELKGQTVYSPRAYSQAIPGVNNYADSGGASRFFYTAKASTDERITHNGTAHPTVKPLDLMRWLVRLVTPPGGTILEPFAGSGTTVEAALLEGFRCIAIEREPDYLPLITQRINRRRDPIAYITAAGEDLGLFELDEGA